jgi:hypothetical protein
MGTSSRNPLSVRKGVTALVTLVSLSLACGTMPAANAADKAARNAGTKGTSSVAAAGAHRTAARASDPVNPTAPPTAPPTTSPPAPPPPPQFTPATLNVLGDLTVGGLLSTALGSFGSIEPTELGYDWYRSGTKIANAHESTYEVRPADAGHQLSVRVTAQHEGMTPLTVASPPTGVIAPGAMIPGTVKIAGGVRVGVELEAKVSGFGPLDPTKYTYQWLRGGKAIKGATERTYLVVDKDVGKKLSVRVTASRRAFVDSTVTSAKSKKVPKRPKWVDPRCMSGKVLCVDMNPKDRKVRWVVNGKVKMTLDARFGASSTPTRKGVYRVYLKSKDHFSTLFDTPMPFAMFFSGGQAVHYSPDFAARGYNGASHGCVNTRDRAAIAKLFSKVSVGDKVVVYS